MPAAIVARVLAALAALAAGLVLVPDAHAATAALKITAAAVFLAFVPGTLVTLLWRPVQTLTLLELLALGAAAGFGVVQLLTVAALTAHVPAASIAVGLVAVSLAAALWVSTRRHHANGMQVILRKDEGLLAFLLAGLAVFLYQQGAPLLAYEDQVHVAIARRLAMATCT